MTEIPKKKVIRRGKPLGRHSLYRDFSIVEVENDKSKKDMVPDRSTRNVSTLYTLLSRQSTDYFTFLSHR